MPSASNGMDFTMKTLILTTTMAAATLGLTCCFAADGVVTAAKPTKSVLRSARPQYVARAQAPVPVETPRARVVEPAPLYPHNFSGYRYLNDADPYAGTWWEGFWSEHCHGKSCWGGPAGGCGGHGGRGGKLGGCGKRAMSGKFGRCGGHCGDCNECLAHDGSRNNQDVVEQPQPDLDTYFEPMDPPGFDTPQRDVAPMDTPLIPQAPRRLSPPRNALPKNPIPKAAPSVEAAAKRIDTAVKHYRIEQASAGTVLRFRTAPTARPVMREPKSETADLLFRQTVR